MIDWKEIRAQFPAVERCTYLNAAGGGPLCRGALDAIRSYSEDMYRVGDLHWDEWLVRVDEVRARLARLLNGEPEEIAFLQNASLGMNLMAEMVEDGGNVLTFANEFPSVTLPWLHRGFPVRFLEPNRRGGWSEEEIRDAITPDTRYLVTSHVQYTGFRHDLETLGALCRRRDLMLIVDATQSFGTGPIDVQRCGVDALMFSGYKWLSAGYGIAALFVRRELLRARKLPSVGWRSSREPYDLAADRLDLTDQARGLELGHPPFAGALALDGSLSLLEHLGLDAVAARIGTLTDLLHREMAAAGVPVLSPAAGANRSAITLLGVPDAAGVAEALKKKGVFVSARDGGLRVSLHFYNDEGDIRRFAVALNEILATGR